MSIVRRTLDAFPRGRSTRELVSLLSAGERPLTGDDVRAELELLSKDGVVRLGRDGKWRLRTRRAGPESRQEQPVDMPSAEADAITAIPARFSLDTVEAISVPEEIDAPPGLQALLRYYRSAIRSDPRGALNQSLDTYGANHVFLSGSGPFWPRTPDDLGTILINVENLPDAFREALARRDANETALAIGWPLEVGQQAGVPSVWPVGLLAGAWSHDGNDLVVKATHTDVLVNPAWIKQAARGTRWSEVELTRLLSSPDGTGLPQDEFLDQLNEAQASRIRGDLNGEGFQPMIDPQIDGIVDSLGLFLATESTFTAGAASDLDTIASWPDAVLSDTALSAVLGDKMEAIDDTPPINTGPLNAEQFDAVEAAMTAPLTVVTGPPGTGKSQAIVAMAASIIHSGGAVLVASKNHQALDAVKDRLGSLANDVDFVVRTLDAENNSVSARDVLDQICRSVGMQTAAEDPHMTARLTDLARRRQRTMAGTRRRRTVRLKLADAVESLEVLEAADTPETTPELGRSFWQRLIGLFGSAQRSVGASRAAKLKQRISKLEVELNAIPIPDDAFELSDEITGLAQSVIAKTLACRVNSSYAQLADLRSEQDDLELAGRTNLSRNVLEQVIDHRPVWLASVLGTPKRIPLHPGLFDLVIFDEASQCDIGSALPLVARAKRAVVVGDDRQLRFIPGIGAAQDRNLMAAQGLTLKGMGRFAQGRKSLFDLAFSTPGAKKVLLRDQYRSTPDIVDYISHEFYGQQLRSAAGEAAFKVPVSGRPGLSWTDVKGRRDGRRGNVNVAEVEAIAAHLKTLLETDGYSGSVGIISPFRDQVHALGEAILGRISKNLADRVDLRIATVDKFQGQERDLILFSPVLHTGSAPTAVSFFIKDARRLNVAISRARAVAHVFGDRDFARSGRVRNLATLLDRIENPPNRQTGEGVFDSHWERRVYHALKARHLDPQPQYEIVGRRLDFALFRGDVKMNLEVDGRRWHLDTEGNRKADDLWRDHQLMSLGWKVCRFWVDELHRDLEGCLDHVERELSSV